MPDPRPYLANGVIGLRPDAFGNDGFCCLNGFAVKDLERGGECAPSIPFPLSWDLRLGGWWLSQASGQALVVDRAYRSDRGELETDLHWEAAAGRLRIRQTRWCDRVLPNVTWLRLELHAATSSEVSLRLGLGSRHAEGQVGHRDDGEHGGHHIVDGCVGWTGEGATCGLAWRAEGVAGGSPRSGEGFAACREYRLRMDGGPVVITAAAAVVVDLQHPVPERQATRLCWLASQRGYDAMHQAHAAAWDELLLARPRIETADPTWQIRSDAAFSWVHQSVHAASPCMTGLFGLSLGDDYHYFNGHRFWDLDTYVTPALLLTDPDAGAAMLDWRWRGREAARRNAQMNGYRGIQYPWEAAQRHAAEVTPVDYAHIIHEQHVNLAVARAFQLGGALLDEGSMLRERSWPILREIARWCASRVDADGTLRASMGICEGIVSDRNTFVQLVMRRGLAWATATARAVGEHPDPDWARIADALLSEPEANGVLPVSAHCTAADAVSAGDVSEVLAAFYPYGHSDEPAVERATIDHYLRVGERACGMPMLPPLYAVLAARLGERERAAELLERGLGQYVFGPDHSFDEFGATHTTAKPRVGPYLAHAGALLMNLLYGWPGLEPQPGAIGNFAARPAALPAAWDAIHVERLWIRGRPVRLEAEHGRPARLTVLDETPVSALATADAAAS